MLENLLAPCKYNSHKDNYNTDKNSIYHSHSLDTLLKISNAGENEFNACKLSLEMNAKHMHNWLHYICFINTSSVMSSCHSKQFNKQQTKRMLKIIQQSTFTHTRAHSIATFIILLWCAVPKQTFPSHIDE